MRAMKIAATVMIGLASLAAHAAGSPAGTASLVAGAVSAVSATGETRTLSKDDAVYAGDRILTGGSSYVRLGFLDGGSMVLRPNTEFLVEAFSFKPDEVAAKPAQPDLKVAPQAAASANRAVFRLVRGGFRAVSGLVAKLSRDSYAVRTPVATIGVRGTTFFSVACDAACAADPLVKAALPAGESALGGFVTGTVEGSIGVTGTGGGTSVVGAGQYAFTTASGVNVTLTGLPGFLAGEGWMQAAQQAAAAPSATPVANPVAGTGLLTAPVVGGVAAALAVSWDWPEPNASPAKV